MSGKRKDAMSRELHDADFWSKPTRQQQSEDAGADNVAPGVAESTPPSSDGHDYLLDMPIVTLRRMFPSAGLKKKPV